MSRKNRSKNFENKHLNSPSVYQLADIKILLARHDTLTRQLLMPVSTGMTMLLPGVLSLLMTPGGLFHKFYIYLSAAYDASDFYVRLPDGDSSVALPSSVDNRALQPVEDLLPFKRTGHQEMLIKLLEQFHEILSKLLVIQVLQSIGYVGPRKEVTELLRLEADILENQRLYVLDIQPPRVVRVSVSQAQKDQAKERFIKALVQLNNRALSPVIDQTFEFKKFESRVGGKVVHRHYTTYIEREWLEKNFHELADLLAKIYYRLADEVNSPEVRRLAQLTIFESMIAQDFTSPHLILFSILGSLLVNNLVIYPTLKWVYQKNDSNKAITHFNKEYLSSERADKLIDLLRAKNTRMQKNVSWVYKFLYTAIPSVVTVKALYDYYYYESLSPGFLSAGLWAVGSSLYDGYTMARTHYHQRGLDKEIKLIAQNLDTAVACTNQTWQTFFGKNYSDCYFEYVGKEYDFISASQVNKIVQDILRDNKLSILSWGKYSHTIALQPLDAKIALKINAQIRNYLEIFLKIHQLKKQIEECFRPENVVEMRVRDTQRLPQIKFLVNCSQIQNFDLSGFQALFNRCVIEKTGDYLIITGNTPSESCQFSKREKFIYNKPSASQSKSGDKESKKFVKSEDEKPKSEKNKKGSSIPNLDQFIDDKLGEEKRVRIEWSKTLVYDSKRQGAIKPIDHPILGKNHFIIFNIPEHCFPTPQIYEFSKGKVEEAHLAKSNKKEQGLQFREGSAVDQTVPGNKTFDHLMRAKLLGRNGKGDIRLFAKPHTVGSGANKKFLHEFVSAEIHAH